MKCIILLLCAVMSHTQLNAGHHSGVTSLGLCSRACSACCFSTWLKSEWQIGEGTQSYHSGKMVCTAGEGEMQNQRNNNILSSATPGAHSGKSSSPQADNGDRGRNRERASGWGAGSQLDSERLSPARLILPETQTLISRWQGRLQSIFTCTLQWMPCSCHHSWRRNTQQYVWEWGAEQLWEAEGCL